MAMKHPLKTDFHTVVTAAGVSVKFKPTNSTYSFYKFGETGALLLAGIQHAGRDTDDYPSDEVQEMAQQVASEHAPVFFDQFQDEEEVNRAHIVWSVAVSNSAQKGASYLRVLAKVEKWMAIIREINRERSDRRRHPVDYAI